MNYYRTCSYCGANLDPGERCDCRDERLSPPKSQTFGILQKKTARGADNTTDGRAEQV